VITVNLGISGLSARQNAHLGALFRGKAQRGDLAFSFLREGLRCGDKCLGAVDSPDRDALLAPMNADVETASVSLNPLDTILFHEIYLTESAFLVRDVLDYWDSG
jgi:hypothetical protein